MRMAWRHGRPVRVALLVCFGAAFGALAACSSKDATDTLTIATVNNGDMVILKKLAPEFERQNPGIHLKWVVLEENVLRQRVTTDVATGAGQFDVVTIGNYEVPSWAKQGWLKPMTDIPVDYGVDDLIAPVRESVTYQGMIYALPFYAESAMTYYRTDLFAAAGLRMPEHPTYAQIAEFAGKLDDRVHQTFGICLRGKPGWGENMAIVTMLVHAFGGRWFDPGWRTAIDSPEWHRAITYYSDLLKDNGPPGATSNGFNENLVLFASGHCALWIDSTVAATLLYDGKQSQIAGKVNYAPAPVGDDPKAPTWLWSWNLAIPASSKHADAALKFVTWATSKHYIRLVAKTEGWIAVPPGTRQSTYEAPEYRQAAPFADFVLNAINTALPANPDMSARPYRGAQFVAIPEFQGIGTQVGQAIAATLTGQSTVDDALKEAQSATERTMRQAGYLK
jgi:sorbitol/mannitol transport system substrate-binding protein